MIYGSWISVNIGSDNGWLPDGTKPLPEPRFGVQQRDSRCTSTGWELQYRNETWNSSVHKRCHASPWRCILCHDDIQLWRHKGLMCRSLAPSSSVGPPKSCDGGKRASERLCLRHCGFGKPRAIPRQLIVAVGPRKGSPRGLGGFWARVKHSRGGCGGMVCERWVIIPEGDEWLAGCDVMYSYRTQGMFFFYFHYLNQCWFIISRQGCFSSGRNVFLPGHPEETGR